MIHPTAIIDKSATIGKNVSIGAYSVIDADVVIGDDCQISHHVHISGPTTLGRGNKIYPFGSIGCDPQDKKYAGERTSLVIGDHNIFRESVTISRGTVQDNSLTQIGDNNLFMAYVHIAHDCCVGSHNTFSNNASLAGHVHTGDYIGFGGFSAVHQFTHIGSYAFCAGGCIVTRDVPPFTLVSGLPAKLSGLNSEGLKRRDFSVEQRNDIKNAYKQLFRESGVIHETANALLSESESEHVKQLALFILNSKRGIAR